MSGWARARKHIFEKANEEKGDVSIVRGYIEIDPCAKWCVWMAGCRALCERPDFAQAGVKRCNTVLFIQTRLIAFFHSVKLELLLIVAEV